MEWSARDTGYLSLEFESPPMSLTLPMFDRQQCILLLDKACLFSVLMVNIKHIIKIVL